MKKTDIVIRIKNEKEFDELREIYIELGWYDINLFKDIVFYNKGAWCIGLNSQPEFAVGKYYKETGKEFKIISFDTLRRVMTPEKLAINVKSAEEIEKLFKYYEVFRWNFISCHPGVDLCKKDTIVTFKDKFEIGTKSYLKHIYPEMKIIKFKTLVLILNKLRG